MRFRGSVWQDVHFIKETCTPFQSSGGSFLVGAVAGEEVGAGGVVGVALQDDDGGGSPDTRGAGSSRCMLAESVGSRPKGRPAPLVNI